VILPGLLLTGVLAALLGHHTLAAELHRRWAAQPHPRWNPDDV
jgi:hypothetical protein